MEQFEQMKIRAEVIPEEITAQYNLSGLVVDRWLYIEIRKSMYGLPQVGLLANIQLKTLSKAWLPSNHIHPRLVKT